MASTLAADSLVQRDARPVDARVGARLAAGAHAPALDGLRGLAILLVMVSHFITDAGTNPSNAFDDWLYNVSMFGWVGVDLFFVLSGFLITGILCDTHGDPNSFRNFYVRRILRIFPLYYGFLLLWFLALPVVPGWPAELVGDGDGRAWAWAYLTNLLQAFHSDLAAAPPYVGHFWSLAVEEQFYLLWPFVVFLCGPRRLLWAIVACLALAPAVRLGLALAGNGVAAYVLTPARMDALAGGALLAVLARGTRPLTVSDRALAAAALASLAAFGALATVTLPEPHEGLLMQTLGHSTLVVLFGATLLAALTAPPGSAVARTFGHPVLRFFGRYSYALYVFHLPAGFFLDRCVLRVADTMPLLGSRTPALLLFVALATFASVAAALVSWHAFEKHFLWLKNRFPYRSSAGAKSVPAAEHTAHFRGRSPTATGGSPADTPPPL